MGCEASRRHRNSLRVFVCGSVLGFVFAATLERPHVEARMDSGRAIVKTAETDPSRRIGIGGRRSSWKRDALTSGMGFTIRSWLASPN